MNTILSTLYWVIMIDIIWWTIRKYKNIEHNWTVTKINAHTRFKHVEYIKIMIECRYSYGVWQVDNILNALVCFRVWNKFFSHQWKYLSFNNYYDAKYAIQIRYFYWFFSMNVQYFDVFTALITSQKVDRSNTENISYFIRIAQKKKHFWQ